MYPNFFRIKNNWKATRAKQISENTLFGGNFTVGTINKMISFKILSVSRRGKLEVGAKSQGMEPGLNKWPGFFIGHIKEKLPIKINQ